MSKKQNDGWLDESNPDKPNQHIGCGNGFYGCGKQCRIIGYDKKAERVLAENFNPAVRLCISCCNAIAYEWWIEFEDLDFLMTALMNSPLTSRNKTNRDPETALKHFAKMGGRRKREEIPSHHAMARIG